MSYLFKYHHHHHNFQYSHKSDLCSISFQYRYFKRKKVLQCKFSPMDRIVLQFLAAIENPASFSLKTNKNIKIEHHKKLLDFHIKKNYCHFLDDQLQFCIYIGRERLFLHKYHAERKEASTNWFLLKCHPGPRAREMAWSERVSAVEMSLMRYKSRAIITMLPSIRSLNTCGQLMPLSRLWYKF